MLICIKCDEKQIIIQVEFPGTQRRNTYDRKLYIPIPIPKDQQLAQTRIRSQYYIENNYTFQVQWYIGRYKRQMHYTSNITTEKYICPGSTHVKPHSNDISLTMKPWDLQNCRTKKQEI